MESKALFVKCQIEIDIISLRGHGDAEIAQALLTRLRGKNYIPAAAQEEYRQALLREFKRALGEPVAEESRGLSIKVLGPGCPTCDRLEQTVMAVLLEMSLPAAVEHVRDVKEIAALGVFCTPALMINGEVMAVGSPPTKAMLKKWLVKCQTLQK